MRLHWPGLVGSDDFAKLNGLFLIIVEAKLLQRQQSIDQYKISWHHDHISSPKTSPKTRLQQQTQQTLTISTSADSHGPPRPWPWMLNNWILGVSTNQRTEDPTSRERLPVWLQRSISSHSHHAVSCADSWKLTELSLRESPLSTFFCS